MTIIERIERIKITKIIKIIERVKIIEIIEITKFNEEIEIIEMIKILEWLKSNNLMILNCMPFLFGGKWSIDLILYLHLYIFIIPSPVWAGIDDPLFCFK